MTQKLHHRVYIQRTQNADSKEYMHLYVHCNIIYNRQDTKAIQVIIDRQVEKEVVHIYNELSLGHKNKRMKSYHL